MPGSLPCRLQRGRRDGGKTSIAAETEHWNGWASTVKSLYPLPTPVLHSATNHNRKPASAPGGSCPVSSKPRTTIVASPNHRSTFQPKVPSPSRRTASPSASSPVAPVARPVSRFLYPRALWFHPRVASTPCLPALVFPPRLAVRLVTRLAAKCLSRSRPAAGRSPHRTATTSNCRGIAVVGEWYCSATSMPTTRKKARASRAGCCVWARDPRLA